MPGVVWVALGGAIGSVARYGVNLGLPRYVGTGFPWATLLVNVLGCFAIGLISTFLISKFPENDGARLFLTTGLLGGFTTFSAFSLDFFLLMNRGEMASAIFYALASVLLSIAAVSIGFLVARALVT